MERQIVFNDGNIDRIDYTKNNDEWISYTDKITSSYPQNKYYLVITGYDHFKNRNINTFITSRKQEFLNYCDSACCEREDILIMIFDDISDVLLYLDTFNELLKSEQPFYKKIKINLN
jgi:hypothetical protein